MAASDTLPVRVIRYGVDEPLPERRLLRAGPVTAVIDGSNLRYVRVGGHEIVRGVYMALRDRNWGTVAPRFLSYSVDQSEQGFVVRFRAEHIEREIDFVWDGTISGNSDGTVTYVMDGEVRNSFMRNRIGICLLHPMSLAGVPVEIGQDGGETVYGVFPVRISPHQPFKEMVTMSYQVGDGIQVDTRFEGDIFEMEDQRNWTDASYKTYSTPLRIPFPVEVKAGERVRQILTVSVKGAASSGKTAATMPKVSVSLDRVAMLPGLGLGTPSHGLHLAASQLDALRLMRLDHLHHEVYLLQPEWERRLATAGAAARALGVPLELEVDTDARGSNLAQLVRFLAEKETPVARLAVFDNGTMFTTTRALMEKIREILIAAKVAVLLGGGSRAYFTEMNRATLPVEMLQFAQWGISPQVHAFDNASIVETLEAEAVTVESCRAIVGDIPLLVGPITLRPRFNPNATGPAPEPGQGELPAEVDARQMSLFAAAWTVGSLRHLGSAGTTWLTYFETTGWRGVMDDPRVPRHPAFPSPEGATFPVYHVLADAGEFAGAEMLKVSTSDNLAVEALALRSGNKLRLLVANVEGEKKRVALELPPFSSATLRILDENSAAQAMDDPAAFRQRVDGEFGASDGRLEMELSPYAVATLDATLN